MAAAAVLRHFMACSCGWHDLFWAALSVPEESLEGRFRGVQKQPGGCVDWRATSELRRRRDSAILQQYCNNIATILQQYCNNIDNHHNCDRCKSDLKSLDVHLTIYLAATSRHV